MGSLSRYLRGWLSDFRFSQTPSVLRDLESWVHRRLRSLLWKRWKRGPVRFAELRKRGAGHDLAAQSAGSRHNVWRLSRSPALNFALPGKFWQSLGLPSFREPATTEPAEPPWYGPVRPVVWEGDHPPYPDPNSGRGCVLNSGEKVFLADI